MHMMQVRTYPLHRGCEVREAREIEISQTKVARKDRRLETHVLRVVILRTLVGMRMGPLTRRSLSLARLMRSVETEDRGGRRTRTRTVSYWSGGQ